MSAFTAGEARWLTEPGTCPQHGTPTDSWGYCGACDDEAYEYQQEAAQQRDDRAAAHGRDHA